METGTEILIARMASHPEEFVEGALTKWTRVMDMANGCLPDEDLQALGDAYKKAKIERFNGEVLATLAGERELLTVSENTVRYKAQERYSTGWTDPAGSFGQAPIKGEGQTVKYDSYGRTL
jgi:hypothetical protein